MTGTFRPAVGLALCLLVAACGGGGPILPGSSLAPLPQAPESLIAELAPGNEEVLLQWTAPPPAPDRAPVTGYAVYLESTGGQPMLLGRTDSLSYRWSGRLSLGLAPGQRYVFHVRAVSDVGRSQASAPAFVDVPPDLLPPLAPESFMAELVPGNEEVLLQWTAPPPAPDRAPVTGYAVYVESTGGRPMLLGRTDSLSYRWSGRLSIGLTPGQRYVFHVRAVSGVGDSQASAPAFVDVPLVLPPLAPESFMAELAPGNEEVLLQWTAPPPAPERAPVTGYTVYLESTGGRPMLLGRTDSLSYRWPGPPSIGLAPGQRYVFHVRAESDAGHSSPASAPAFVDVPPDLLPPLAPGSFMAELAPGNEEVLLQWTAPPPAPDRAPVTGYAVYLESAGGRPMLLGRTGSLSYRWSGPSSIGLAPGQRYVFHVRAESDAGHSSPASAPAFVDVPPDLLPPLAPGSFLAELAPGNEEVLLQWTAPPPAPERAEVTGYAVYRETPDGRPVLLGRTDSLSYRWSGSPSMGLAPGQRYVFHVRAESDAGHSSPASAPAFVDVPPDLLPPLAPESFMAELTSIEGKVSNEVLLQWTAPEADEIRAPVTGYAVYRELPGGGEEYLGETRSLSFVHSGLLPGSRYVFYVRALSGDLSSEPSVSAAVEVPAEPIVPLSVPHVTVRADAGAGMAVISWIHGLAPHISAVVDGFSVQYCEVADPQHADDHCATGWKDHASSPFGPTIRAFTDRFQCNHTATTMSGARMYRTQALSDIPSASSRYSVPTTPVCPSSTYSPPRRVDAVFAVDHSVSPAVNICWDAPLDNGNPIVGYELQATTGEELPVTEDEWVIVDGHVGPDASPICRWYTGVRDNVYWFRVRAYNLAGHGHWSAPYQYEHGGPPVPSASSGGHGRIAVSVADTRAREDVDAALVFDVTLDRAASEPVTVDYATADGTATAGDDYRAAFGTLAFAAGETSKTIEVAVLGDTTDEGIETLALHLSNPNGAFIADGEATGIIEDGDLLQKAWIARFGRTVAGQMVDAVGARVHGSRHAHVTVAGVSIDTTAEPGSVRTLRPWGAHSELQGRERLGETRSSAIRRLLAGSSFHLDSRAGGGPVFAAWGRFATGDVESEVHDLRLDGAVTTGILGGDVEGDRWLAGAAIAYSEGDGTFSPPSGMAAERNRGEVGTTMTGMYPYARLAVSERVSLWGLAGAGQGTLTLSDGGASVETDIGMTMGAFGARGTILSPPVTGGLELAVRSDAFWLRTTSDAARFEAAEVLADSRADASRLRLSVEGSRALALGAKGMLTPTFELGVRHDGGAAEDGTGIEAGAGVRFAGEGVAIEGTVRTLVAHEADSYEEWGASGSVRIDPGTSGKGLSLTLAPTIGAGADRVGRLRPLDAAPGFLEPAQTDSGKRLDARLGYGLGLPELRGTLTPYTGVSFTVGGAHSWRVGTHLTMPPDFTLRLEGMHWQHDDDPSDRSVTLRGGLYW